MSLDLMKKKCKECKLNYNPSNYVKHLHGKNHPRYKSKKFGKSTKRINKKA